MAFRIRWSPRAADDLEAIAEYKSLDSPAYAKICGEDDRRDHSQILTVPLAGRIVPEFNDEQIREWFAYSYRIIYRLDQNVVTVAAIIHGKRMLSID
jgi:plasmid stabilization system protein ParE